MRVTLVSNAYLPHLGGIEVHMGQLAAGLQRLGVDVRVACPTDWMMPELPVGESIHDGVPVQRVPALGFGEAIRWPGRLIEPGSADVVHFQGFWRPLLLRTLRDLEGTPLVITPHGGVEGVAIDDVALRRNAKRIVDRAFARRWLSRAFRVLCLSSREIEHLRDSVHVPAAKLTLLPNPVDVTRASRPGTNPSGRLLVLSRLARHKRIGELIRVLAANPDLPGADVAGPDGDDAVRLRSLGASLPSSRVRFLGPVTGNAKLNLLTSSKALVLCTEMEAHPLSALEAVAAGIPVIASTRTAESLPPGTVLPYPTGHDRALADRIRSLDQPEVLTRLAGASARAREHLVSPDRYAELVFEIYQEAA